jgi:hypothetical protein
MKRAKIMLVAIAVLATVGGALAFKAQKFGSTKYCYTITDDPKTGTGACPEFTADSKITAIGAIDIWYTTTTGNSQTECAQVTQCPLLGHNIEE